MTDLAFFVGGMVAALIGGGVTVAVFLAWCYQGQAND